MTAYNLTYRVTSLTGIVKEHTLKVDRIGIYHCTFKDEHELIFERHGFTVPSDATKSELAELIMGLLAKQVGVADIVVLNITEI